MDRRCSGARSAAPGTPHIEMVVLIDGRKRFRGQLLGTDGTTRIRIPDAADGADVLLPINVWPARLSDARVDGIAAPKQTRRSRRAATIDTARAGT